MKAQRWFNSSFIALAAVLVIASGIPAFAQSDGENNNGPDNGTRLAVIVDTPMVDCHSDGNGADVTAAYTVVSTGSADSADVVASIGGVNYDLPTIASGNADNGGGWTFSGRTKTAEGTFTTSLPNGEYTLTICVTQSGANGRLPKQVCSAPVAVTIYCTPDSEPCAKVGPFGEVPHNKNLCKTNTSNIEIQFRGDFGEQASLEISGPSGFFLPVLVDRAGESCNYHYNWNPPANQAPGTYTFTVNGTLTFSADLICK